MQLRSGTLYGSVESKKDKEAVKASELSKKVDQEADDVDCCAFCHDPLRDDYGPGMAPYGICDCGRAICPFCAPEYWWQTCEAGKCLKCCREEYASLKNDNCDGEDDDRFDDGVIAYIEKRYKEDRDS